MSEYTPGPWHWEAEDASVMALLSDDSDDNSDGFVLWSGICPACQKNGFRCTAPNDANAALIAKVPELLAIAEEYARFLDPDIDKLGSGFAARRILERRQEVEAIIKEAGGEV